VLELLKEIVRCLEKGEEVVSAAIVGHVGSTPRGAGSKMLMRRDGSIAGSVGGGLLEAEVMRRAQGLFESPGAMFLDFDLSGEEAAESGMICGGAVRVFLDHLSPDEDTAALFELMAETVVGGRKAVLLTLISGPAEEPQVVDRYFLYPGEMPPADFARQALDFEEAGILERGSEKWVVEPFAIQHTAFIMGAGHVGLAAARLAKSVGFRTVVMDDREEFANRQRFPEADEIRVLDSFQGCFDGMSVDESSFIVILTRGHVHDKTVLARALEARPGYLGMIGSRRKRDAVYDALAEEGVPRERLAEVHSPIGLSIGARTPEEIAVSIVAEMILVRAEMTR
jgi:xanthine dehydrogenase accessory factor